jgi:tetratricopeptide (TPR) repeat protein
MDNNNDILTDGIDERIESFLRGTMTAEEEAAFKQEIKANPELRNRAKAMASLIHGLQAKNTAKERTIIKGNTTKSKVRPILWWVCSAAAVFAIVFGIYKDHRYSMLNATVSPYYTEYDMSDISRGDVDSVSIAHLYMLFSQIQDSRNVSNIVKELEPIYHSLDDDFTYYPWANDIAWNLALAYVKDDQIDKAISILEKLKQDNPDTPLYNKANELIKKLREL